MQRKPLLSLLTVVLTMVVVIAALVFGSHASPAHAAGVNVQVNQVLAGPFPKNKQNEPSIAQNPMNLSNLIAGSNDEIGLPPCTNTTPSNCPFVTGISVSGFYGSSNGGASW